MCTRPYETHSGAYTTPSFAGSFAHVQYSIALTKDDNAVVFGEDIAFGGVFRCTMVSALTSMYAYSSYEATRVWQKNLVWTSLLCFQPLNG